MQPNQNLVIAQVVKFLNGQNCLVWRQENNGRIDIQEATKKITQLLIELRHVPNYDASKIGPLVKQILNKCYRGVPCSMKGVSDVIGFSLSTGAWISVEVKVGDDQMRPDQTDFAAIVRAAGAAEFWICREINSFKTGWFRKHPTQSAAA